MKLFPWEMTSEQKEVIERNPSMRYWSDTASAVSWILLIEEDFGYSFKTVEQRYNPFCNLPYGPKFNNI